MAKLTEKQKLFCEAYLRTGDEVEAFGQAYSTKGLSKAAIQRKAKALLKHKAVKEFLKENQNPNPVGRPSKYNQGILDKAQEYLLHGYEDFGSVIPSVAGLACYLGIRRSTLYEWATQYPEFSDTLDAISEKQEMVALNRGLDGTFNPTITKLVLANHGYSESQKIDHQSSDGSMTPKSAVELTDEQLAAIAAGN